MHTLYTLLDLTAHINRMMQGKSSLLYSVDEYADNACDTGPAQQCTMMDVNLLVIADCLTSKDI